MTELFPEDKHGSGEPFAGPSGGLSGGPSAGPSEALPQASPTPWKALLPALAVSVLAHAIVLSLVRVDRARRAAEPALVVTLRPAIVARPAAAPQPVAPPAAVAPAPPPPAVAPAPVPAAPVPPPPAAVPAPPVPPPPRPPPAPPAPEPPQPAAVAPRRDVTFRPAEELSQAPIPQADPGLGELQGRVVGRRLQVTVWIDDAGTVRQAEVARNELSPEVAALLEAALGKVRFSPGLADGQPSGAILRTLLCFDDAGQLDEASPECWRRVPAAPER